MIYRHIIIYILLLLLNLDINQCFTLFWLQPDLLNLKKGWLNKCGEGEVWTKHWFVLADQTLKYFVDAMAEEVCRNLSLYNRKCPFVQMHSVRCFHS